MLVDESKNLLAIFDVMFLSDSLKGILKTDFFGTTFDVTYGRINRVFLIFELWVVFLKLAPNNPWQASKLSLMTTWMAPSFQRRSQLITLLPLNIISTFDLVSGESLKAPAAAPSRPECELDPAASQLAAHHDEADDELRADDDCVRHAPNLSLEPFVFDDRDSDRESDSPSDDDGCESPISLDLFRRGILVSEVMALVDQR